MWVADSERCRETDSRAHTEFGIEASELIERAGRALSDRIRPLLTSGSKVFVVCGKGNNGADGIALARFLTLAGIRVKCGLAYPPDALGEEARKMYERAVRAETPVVLIGDEPSAFFAERSDRDLVVDALLGTGNRGELSVRMGSLTRAINRSGLRVVAVDCPTGVSADTGVADKDAVTASKTYAFGYPKPGYFLRSGPSHLGDWELLEIGFPPRLLEEPSDTRLVTAPYAAALFPVRRRDSHKKMNGRVTVVAGSAHMPGAATLCVSSAARSGAGLVTIASLETVCRSVLGSLPEALMSPVKLLGKESQDEATDSLPESDAVVVGPGLGGGRGVSEFLTGVFRDVKVPCVIDADALNLVAEGLELPKAPCVLTPHPGEAARLLGWSTSRIQEDRFSAVKELVKQTGKTVVLKGANSVTFSPGSVLEVNGSGNSGMATAGMGDVLAGIIGTLLAQGLPPHEACTLGVYWHGAAGDRCAKEIGEVGFLASDVAKALPRARTQLLAESR